MSVQTAHLIDFIVINRSGKKVGLPAGAHKVWRYGTGRVGPQTGLVDEPVVQPLALASHARLEVVDALAIELVVAKVALVPVAVGKVHDTFAFAFVVHPIADIDVAVGKVEGALAVELVVQKVALIPLVHFLADKYFVFFFHYIFVVVVLRIFFCSKILNLKLLFANQIKQIFCFLSNLKKKKKKS